MEFPRPETEQNGGRSSVVRAAVALLVVVGLGMSLVWWFSANRGSPPPVIVVAGESTSKAPPSSKKRPKPSSSAAPAVTIPPVPAPLPEGAGYTAAPLSERPDMYTMHGGSNYGWWADQNAQCDQWDQGMIVGRTPEIKYSVCKAKGGGAYFKGLILVDATPIRASGAAGGTDFAGSGGGVSVVLTKSKLTLVRGGVKSVYTVVQRWVAPR
ncbi:hypothetical protein GOEFS_106_00270 [Gordonia effusa NBRC 100432]|uniref:Uncharacterized protein n=1 Tax=Gordonia effusa NBRC 100432 TaxID=1077974 RepID=H0R4Y0_9ACTN|nr:hypothetical protein [Gordonia effusa]GAB20131.1 hypothetical protein GOEFS_106_00270 [Gordonia effusa NBRC 100432]